MKKQQFILLIVLTISLLSFTEIGFAETITGDSPFDELLIAIIEIVEGAFVTAGIIVAVVISGLMLVLTPTSQDTLRTFIRIILGSCIAVKGSSWLFSILGVGWLC